MSATAQQLNFNINPLIGAVALRQKRRGTWRTLDERKDASDDAWEDFKAGSDSASGSLGSSLKSAALRLVAKDRPITLENPA